jgi:RNA polymerase sigma-70 factor (ECF subfamily)
MPAVAKREKAEPPDEVLLGRVAAGDDEAFTALVRRYERRFYGVARRMLGEDAEAEDAVQAALLRIYRNAPAYRDRWSGSTWLYRVLTNVCIDHWRKRRPRHDAPDPSCAPGSGPAERLDLDRALAKLPAEARAILLLCYVEELSYGEIARARGISVNTVKTQLSRAKRLMRRHLDEVTT